jgi:hypothetical protein
MAQLKPQNGANWPSRGKTQDDGDVPSPWAGVELAMGAKPQGRKRWGGQRQGLGSTPPSDGPWKPAAEELARLIPPHTRVKRSEPGSSL